LTFAVGLALGVSRFFYKVFDFVISTQELSNYSTPSQEGKQTPPAREELLWERCKSVRAH
jgi:hypothetical protein